VGDPAQTCGCPEPPRGGVHDLVDPATDLLIDVDRELVVVDGYPHTSRLLAATLCHRPTLRSVIDRAIAEIVADRVAAVRSTGRPDSFEARTLGWRGRLSPSTIGTRVLLHAETPQPADDASFWQLFDAAPVPLVIEVATSPDQPGATRLNRRFTEVFGYSAEDVPTVHAWWPLAYPEPEYRTRISSEWFRRVHAAIADQSAIEPMRTNVTCKDGSLREIEFFAAAVGARHVVVFVDHTERNKAARQLREAHDEVAALKELLPVCAWCKKLRDDHGYWEQLEQFVQRRTGATLTHGICDECREQHFHR
jgi:PAS domain-containing protein